MKPIWVEPERWEDYLNGMFENNNRQDIVIKCHNLLKSDCYSSMKEVTKKWPLSTSVNFSKRVWNNNAWLGQATCSLYFGATIQETTQAWINLTIKEQKQANEIAERVIEEWINEKILKS